ncbi:mycothiol system anti-sigma-R factor [Citricoccus muralis]|uniref:Mycothiol system anti-sigma-R factor n=1 Tax=Citricoccus muralis TaxID=169134 RepID=A0ABY8H9F7_9MICC|nr:mycothiol system anti-sigma-R factor [Citricoccus muralis]WFP17656.1 mycothiol system anti-sigma-R factor [Citricoccus muralis]
MSETQGAAPMKDDQDCQKIGDCHDARVQRIYEYLDGALSHHDIEEVRLHLTECTDCNAEHDLECIIRSVVKRSCSEKAPDQLKTSIITRISEIRVKAGH